MKQKLITTLAAVALTFVGATAATPVYLDPSKPLEERVEDALQRMTLEEKVGVLHAQSKFCSRGVQRLGIPELWTTDGPHGIRPEVLWDEWEQAAWTNDSCVAFPALTALAATWNPELAELYGRSLGEEALYRGKDVVLGPGVNIYRTPLNGRNFEYMGEDPLLASRMVVPYIKGLQSNGVAACVKHYALNNNEVNRHTSNVIVDDRTLYEIYLPAFKAAVTEGGAWSIMGSYNLYQNQHGCHNKRLLCDILRDEWGFDGVVISDWGGTHDTAEAVENGLDLEFGSWTNGLTNGRSNAYDNYYLADPYLKMLREGKADMATLDNKVRNVLRLIFRTAMKSDKGFGSLCSDEHYAAARRIGAEGIVLLRNKGNLLPLDPSKPQNILVVGENAVKMMTVGGGSSSLKVQRETSPLDGLRAQAPAGSTVVWERGYVGDPTGEYNGVTSGQDLSESRSADRLIADAADAARRADVVIFVGGLNKATGQDCEDSDRESLALPYNQDAVIEALVAANPRTVVVNVSGNAVAMPWADKVPAILQAWFLGSESGNSLADVIFGRVNPSGKLPMTFPVRLDDVAAHAVGEYPGTKRADSDIVDIRYNEGVMVGYRWFDTRKIRPLFAFGHGLSYTTFGYGKLSADASKIGPDGALTLSVDVTNTGSRAGAETVQLYISDTKASVKRPAKELKNFAKIYLEPGQTKTVTFTVRPSDLAFFDAGAHAWKAEPGEFRAHVGAASDDIRSSLRFVLTD
jgi:beta-glucosidase